MSGSKLESLSSLRLPVKRGVGRAFALTSALALLGCGDTYVTKKYYLSPDASAVTAPDVGDAGRTDAGSGGSSDRYGDGQRARCGHGPDDRNRDRDRHDR
jgi:hypothetical protein